MGGFAAEVSEGALVEALSGAGHVVSVRLQAGKPGSGLHRGYALVTFASAAAAQKACDVLKEVRDGALTWAVGYRRRDWISVRVAHRPPGSGLFARTCIGCGDSILSAPSVELG